ncbi:MAG: hypothetical protein JST22_14640 [Bacteroidetes bacterium]|nr:hypothetical protein [Bacteroidota bacterium]
MRSHFILPVLILACGIVAGGCSGNSPIGNVQPSPIPFELTIPPNRPAADYYAISGVATTTQLERIGDSLIESPIPSFYAQFTHAAGVAAPASVQLNGNSLSRNLGTDTLRLETAGSNVFGNNTWALTDGTGNRVLFQMPSITVLDSVGPFAQKKNFRSDTSLTVTWKVPGPGSSGIYLIWTTPQDTLTIPMVDDFGQGVLSAANMTRLRGKGRVLLVRYATSEQTFNGRTLILTRIAQHAYDVTVD